VLLLPKERIIDARLVLFCANTTILKITTTAVGEDLLGDKKALAGLGVQQGKSIVSPHDRTLLLLLLLSICSCTAPEEDQGD
jgi:hypothetical protein